MRFEKVTNSIPAQLATTRDSISSGVAAPIARPQVRGKFIFVGNEKLYIRGVTYGTFHPDAAGNFYPSPEITSRDFAAMVANEINAVRTYTVPPRWLLDLAAEYGLWVMVGLPWEQHIAFLDDRKRVRSLEQRIRASVRSCAGHPALLCYAIGNEIPAGIVRWYGRHRVERFLARLYRIAKREDPDSLVTYVNYPTTEYLQLRFVDFVCFNVYLEQQNRLAAYIARLQNLAGDRPLVLAELGLDSRRNGKQKQAEILDWQLRTTFASGCAGTFVFAWTDEWYRGGYNIDDWDFGITDRQRRPKPALHTVRQAFAQVPFPALSFPTISVVVCSYNGSHTIRDTLAGLAKLEYPYCETIVVDDGSTDNTAAIASEYDVRLIRTPQSGLSHARNVGMQAATGEIVAYIDDDAYPDPHWLTYLAITFMETSHVGVGGPNLPPPEDGMVAQCVANAPGGPSHVLLSDQEAEHIPGCNMAFRKSCLEAIAGFDPQFRTAGDDVDICWRLQEQGWTIGFSPAAVVWHHRRNSVWRYWKQQQGYGKAEALLEQKWTDKYNILGHLTWSGRIYGPSVMYGLSVQERVFYGTWGSALFQSIYQPMPGTLRTLLLMPEWYLVVMVLVGLSLLGGVLWTPMWLISPLALVAIAATLIQVCRSAAQAKFPNQPKSHFDRWRRYSLTAVLYLLQPLARLKGRFRYGLQPWRWYGMSNLALPLARVATLWSASWHAPQSWLTSIETAIQSAGHRVQRGGNFDPWDLEVPGGLFGSNRLLMAIEEHGGGQQLVRLRTWSRWSKLGWMLFFLFVGLTVAAWIDSAWSAVAKLGAIALLLLLRSLYESAVASAVVLQAIERVKPDSDSQLRA
ncbi:glycosyltransferase [Chroococcidiopsis thermalis]|uniref:Glycosyl transferase family 2 n=1 Tax=Chroococcidiopsis thermalis (strain PCC 7203) TaxID=251229 RepID=K9TVJ6_CHRTP|nr:glycosyltransferase [Chroococcidiopsis thermalis]AFY86413.1 glycosyl transferase family 2 [Chroococcidiopsis thermalis PCC 7203]PSB42544.1 glycosyl transferase [Cyanosarcina cf. burmensis CCALA 770]